MSGWSQTVKTVRLLATRYDVTASQCGPFTLGHHTGLGVRNNASTTNWNMSCSLGLQTSVSTAPTSESSLTYNHGRTYDPATNIVAATFTYDTGTGQPAGYEDAIQSCLGWVQDGFCDSVCGNDAYTLPNLAVMTTSDTNWLFSLTAPFTGRSKYGSTPAFWGYASASASLLSWGNYIRVPRYGHNSNNDANAVQNMFAACGRFKTWLDGNCDVLADSNRSCGPNWSLINSQINAQIRSVCSSSCGGLQLANGTYYDVPGGAADADIAAADSQMSNAPISTLSVCPNTQPWSGDYLEGAWPNGQSVNGM